MSSVLRESEWELSSLLVRGLQRGLFVRLRRLRHQHDVDHIERAPAADTLCKNADFVTIVVVTEIMVLLCDHSIRFDAYNARRVLLSD